jgi:periplasmic protein TonB
MIQHLSDRGVCMYIIGEAGVEERQHGASCASCQARIADFVASLSNFRDAVQVWSDRKASKRRAEEMRWTVIPATDHLERMLPLAALDMPWYRSLWGNLCDFLKPEPAPLDVTSKPVLVKDIWGLYGRRKRSFLMSFGFQSVVVACLFLLGVTKPGQQMVRKTFSLVMPAMDIPENAAPPKKQALQGGGGGGGRSPLPASFGTLPKTAPRQFTPPVAVYNNMVPKLAMEPSIVAPDLKLPQVSAANYGDPLSKYMTPSNGPGSGGGIGSGQGGGIGGGIGVGYGLGEGGGFGGAVFRVGGGVTAPTLLQKVEPEYSEAARKAKHQGTVLLYVEVDPSGRAVNVRVQRSLGLGLDEKAVEAVKKWRFRPGTKDGKPVTVAATIEVNFRLL